MLLNYNLLLILYLLSFWWRIHLTPSQLSFASLNDDESPQTRAYSCLNIKCYFNIYLIHPTISFLYWPFQYANGIESCCKPRVRLSLALAALYISTCVHSLGPGARGVWLGEGPGDKPSKSAKGLPLACTCGIYRNMFIRIFSSRYGLQLLSAGYNIKNYPGCVWICWNLCHNLLLIHHDYIFAGLHHCSSQTRLGPGALRLSRASYSTSRSSRAGVVDLKDRGKLWMLVIPVTTFCLGTWQVFRLQWKAGLIEELERKTKEDPVTIPTELVSSIRSSFIRSLQDMLLCLVPHSHAFAWQFSDNFSILSSLLLHTWNDTQIFNDNIIMRMHLLSTAYLRDSVN